MGGILQTINVFVLAIATFLAWKIGKKQNQINEKALNIANFVEVFTMPQQVVGQNEKGLSVPLFWKILIKNASSYPVYINRFSIDEKLHDVGSSVIPVGENNWYEVPITLDIQNKKSFTLKVVFEDYLGQKYESKHTGIFDNLSWNIQSQKRVCLHPHEKIRGKEEILFSNSNGRIKIYVRACIIIILSLSLTFLISSYLSILYTFQPLINNNQIISLEIKPLEILDAPLNLNMELLKYKVLILNNLQSTIEGDGIDYEHQVEVSVRYKKTDSDVMILPFNKEIGLFGDKSLARGQVISGITDLFFSPNINLKPEILSSHIVKPNKNVSGGITVSASLDNTSRIILFVSVLILIGLFLQSIWSVSQFILWKY